MQKFDEISVLLSSRGGMHNQGVIQKYTSIHSSEQMWIKRKGEIDDIKIKLPFLPVLGASTVDWFRENMQSSDIGGGWLVRYILIPQEEIPTAPPPCFKEASDPKLLKQWRDLIVAIHQSKLIEGEWRMEIEARACYEAHHKGAWVKQFAEDDAATDSIGNSIVGRALNNTMRMALVFEILNCGGVPKTECQDGTHYPIITLRSMKQACDLMVFFTVGINRVCRKSLAPGLIGVEASLLEKLGEGPMTGSAVYKFIVQGHRSLRAKDIKEIKESLEAQNYIVSFDADSPKGNKPTTWYRLRTADDDKIPEVEEVSEDELLECVTPQVKPSPDSPGALAAAGNFDRIAEKEEEAEKFDV
jgi:hypothetical protein